jgi:hypothetical protein
MLLLAALPGAGADWQIEAPRTCGAVSELRIESPPFECEASPDGRFIPRVPGGQHALEADQPDLPFFVRLIPIPRACAARIEIVEISSLETNVPEIRPTARHELREDEEGRRWVERVPCHRGPVYAEDVFWPSNALSISYATQGTQRWSRIVFYPLQYNPFRGILRWNRFIEARLFWMSTE